MKRMLEELGHEVEVVGDGRAAVERWRAWQPDAILMDVEMPVMNGLTATRRIRAMEAVGRPEVAIVALSAHTMPAEVEICMRAGMNGHLAKPARSKELERALVTAVRVARSTLKTWNGIEVDTRPH